MTFRFAPYISAKLFRFQIFPCPDFNRKWAQENQFLSLYNCILQNIKNFEALVFVYGHVFRVSSTDTKAFHKGAVILDIQSF